MILRANRSLYFPASLFFALLFSGGVATRCAAQGFTLYTPYTRISVPPGESIDFPIDVINKGGSLKKADIAVSGLPKGWTYDLKSGNLNVSEIMVLPGEKKNFSLHLQVPLKINKGSYHFSVLAKGMSSLPLSVVVSEQGTFKTEFTIDQPNMQGASNATFTFNTKLRNRTSDNQVYALRALAPPGWNAVFKASYKQVSSVSVEANRTQDITIEIDPPDHLRAGTYKIPVQASTSTTSAELALEVGITGSYAVELTTPSGLLSTNITAGDDKRVELLVKNTGSADLKNIDLKFTAPINWDIVFDPKKIEKLSPGQSANVFATLKADKNAIAGDYVTNLEAKTPETSSSATFRVSVKTSALWSWLGIMIIVGSLSSVFYLFKKYGRR